MKGVLEMESLFNSRKYVETKTSQGDESENKESLIMRELAETMNIPHELIEKVCNIANNHVSYHKIYQLFEQEFDDWENGGVQ